MSLEIYERRIAEAVAPFLGRPVSPSTVSMLDRAVRQAQERFLYEYPGYVALGPSRVCCDEARAVKVDAPIGTHQEKWEIEQERKSRAQLEERLVAEAQIESAQAIKREANMLRHHRRLMRRCADRIPPSTKAIWPSLSIGQQYAILKDIDFEMRHRGEPMIAAKGPTGAAVVFSPRFRNVEGDFTALGSFDEFDLWFVRQGAGFPPTLIGRYGDEPDQYLSANPFLLTEAQIERIGPWAKEALVRAKHLHLVPA